MPKLVPSGMGCAVRTLSEFARWQDPDKLIKAIPGVLDSRAPFITFSAVEGGEKGNYGDRLMEYVNGNGFGEVTKVGPAVNHTGSQVAVYTWVVNYDAIIAYFHRERQRLEGATDAKETTAQVAA
jgi:hypothetical protein